MTPIGALLARNTAAKLASELGARAATFLFLLYAARQLGNAGFGLLSLGLAAGFVLAQLADFGLQTVIAREVAAGAERARPAVRAAFRLKLALAVPAGLGMLIVALLRPETQRVAFLLLGLAALAQTFLEFAAYVYRGQQRLDREAWLLGGARFSLALAGALALWRGAALGGLALALAVAAGLATLVALAALRREGWLKRPGTDVVANPALVRTLWRQAAPLGLAVFLSIATTRVALFLISIRLDAGAVGLFSAAQRLVEPTQVLPASFVAALFPAYSLAWRHDPARARRLGLAGSAILALAGIAAAALLWLTAPWLVPLLYGPEFAGTVPVMRWLAPTIAPAFVNYGLTHYVIAQGRQRWLTWLGALTLTLHTGLTWWLLPRAGVMAPAAGLMAAELALLFGCLGVLKSRTRHARSLPPAPDLPSALPGDAPQA